MPCLGLGVIPADPWVILLARAACAGPHACSVQHGKQDKVGVGSEPRMLGVTRISLPLLYGFRPCTYPSYIRHACPSKPRTISMRKKSLHITDLPMAAGDGRFVS